MRTDQWLLLMARQPGWGGAWLIVGVFALIGVSASLGVARLAISAEQPTTVSSRP